MAESKSGKMGFAEKGAVLISSILAPVTTRMVRRFEAAGVLGSGEIVPAMRTTGVAVAEGLLDLGVFIAVVNKVPGAELIFLERVAHQLLAPRMGDFLSQPEESPERGRR